MINSQLLLYLNLGFGLLLLAYFILGRPKPKAPTRLHMRAKESPEAEKQKKQQILQPEKKAPPGKIGVPAVEVLAPEAEMPAPKPTARDLGVIFMYNGHDWEAHEVLGVPQGASMHVITSAYQKLVQTGDAASLPFYEQAYAAISNRHRKHRL